MINATNVLSFQVVKFRDTPVAEYLKLVDSCPWSTVFHTLEWLSIYEDVGPLTQQFMVCGYENKDLVVAMPVTVFHKFAVRAVFSSGFSTYGGPIAHNTDPMVQSCLREFASHFCGFRTVYASIQDFHDCCGALRDWKFQAKEASTHTMTVPGDVDELESSQGSPSKYRNNIRRAQKAGITISQSRSKTEFAEWTELCSLSYSRHGRRPYPQAVYDAIGARLSESDLLRFHVAKTDDRVVAGTVHIFGKKQVLYWMSATTPAVRRYAVNDVLLDQVLRSAIREGYETYDFGASPPEATGLLKFKHKWGGTEHLFKIYEKSNFIGRVGVSIVRYRRGKRGGSKATSDGFSHSGDPKKEALVAKKSDKRS